VSWRVGSIEMNPQGIEDFLIFYDFVGYDRGSTLINEGSLEDAFDLTSAFGASQFTTASGNDLAWSDFEGNPCSNIFSFYGVNQFDSGGIFQLFAYPSAGGGDPYQLIGVETAWQTTDLTDPIITVGNRQFFVLAFAGTPVPGPGASRFAIWSPSLAFAQSVNVWAAEVNFSNIAASRFFINGISDSSATVQVDTTGNVCDTFTPDDFVFTSWDSLYLRLPPTTPAGSVGTPLGQVGGNSTPYSTPFGFVAGSLGFAVNRAPVTQERIDFMRNYPWGS
jgi:hypothetical protein